jgi:hypothetical protein
VDWEDPAFNFQRGSAVEANGRFNRIAEGCRLVDDVVEPRPWGREPSLEAPCSFVRIYATRVGINCYWGLADSGDVLELWLRDQPATSATG